MGTFSGKNIVPGLMLICLSLGLIALPAGAQVGTVPLMEKPAAPPEPKKEEAPTTCGPLISDTCMPIDTYKLAMQAYWTYSMVRANATPNWRQVSANGNFSTFNMPVKIIYGPTKNLEVYAVIPYIHDFAGSVDGNRAGRSANFGGIGDISLVGKYLLLPETDYRPAITGVAGVGFPTGHANHLNPKFLGQDAIGTGAFTFTTGFNFFKWLKPFLFHGQIWYNTPVNLFHASNDAVRSRDFVTFNLAAEYPITTKWIALLEFYSAWTWTNISTPQGFQSPATLLGVLPGIEYVVNDKWALSAGAACDLAGKATTLKVTPVFTVWHSF